MTESEIRKLLERQRTFFSTGKTLPVSFRLRQLEKLKRSIQKNEPLLRHALKKDLGKSNMESYMCEIGLTLSELSWMQRHVRSLAKNRTVPTPLSQFAAHSYRSPYYIIYVPTYIVHDTTSDSFFQQIYTNHP